MAYTTIKTTFRKACTCQVVIPMDARRSKIASREWLKYYFTETYPTKVPTCPQCKREFELRIKE